VFSPLDGWAVVAVARWFRIFDGSLGQLAEARRFVRRVADGHEAVDAAELVVCELAANAVLHTASGDLDGQFVVEVEFGPESVTVPVADMGAEREPVVKDQEAEEEAVSGRGLWIVELLSLKWGFEPTRVGRRVWAVLSASSENACG
jgi:serine/threonine-protein kinase RsbW